MVLSSANTHVLWVKISWSYNTTLVLQAKETEILALKTELGQIKVEHSKLIDSLEQKLFSANMEVKTLKGNLESKSEVCTAG